MKSYLAFFVLLIIAFQPFYSYGQEKEEADTISFAQISMDKAVHNFGEMNQGEKVEQIFNFKNIGNSPLVFLNVLSTCGCTVPEWPKEPVEPGKEGVIKVVFDSTSKIGRQNKVITIRSNSRDGDYRIRISAMVLPPGD